MIIPCGRSRPPRTSYTDQTISGGDPANPGTLRTEMRALRGSNAAAVLAALTPIIRGWAAYYRGVVSSRTSTSLDNLWKLTYEWATRSHANKPKLPSRARVLRQGVLTMLTHTPQAIVEGRTALGIELGSTRIKAVLIGPNHAPLAVGSHGWQNQLVDGLWTYSLESVWAGLQDCYAALAADVRDRHGVELTTVGALGVSAMMHGYLAFDSDGNLLTPFRTWRNTNTGAAVERLRAAFGHNIPHRWSIAHLYQAVLDDEEHVGEIAHLTTLAGYVHWHLTGEQVLGIGDASGMFPIDVTTGAYDATMIAAFEDLVADRGLSWRLSELLPAIHTAGEPAGVLTEAGARLLDRLGRCRLVSRCARRKATPAPAWWPPTPSRLGQATSVSAPASSRWRLGAPAQSRTPRARPGHNPRRRPRGNGGWSQPVEATELARRSVKTSAGVR
jgi:FGGY family of carbohydrate kinases, N-terminal domain/Group II intron, maturase-specific domain